MVSSETCRREAERLRKVSEFRFQLRRFLHFSEIEAERVGVPAQQYQLLQIVGALPVGQTASISYLAQRMVLRHNSTVELVDRAERAGLVKRVCDRRDLRRSVVVLTAKGEEVLERLVEVHLRELEGETGALLLRALGEVRSSPRVADPRPPAGRSV